MQRRAVAVSGALFLLIAVAAFGLLATAQEPGVEFDDPDFELAEGEEFTVDGTTYTVSSIDRTEEENALGETTITREAQVEWSEVQRQTESWSNGSTVTVDGREWTVVIEGEEPDGVTLREVQDREAILEADPAADNETVERDGEEFVVVEEDGEARLVPADDYFPTAEERTIAAGEEFGYANETVTLEEVTSDAATIVWEAPVTMTTDIRHHRNVTVGDTTYVAAIRGGGEDGGDLRLVLSSNIEGFQAEQARIDRFEQRSSGLWRVVVLAMSVVVLLAAMAFLPSRY